MKIDSICYQCFRQSEDRSLYAAEVRDDQSYVVTCKNGHVVKAHIVAPRYHLLYKSGTNALVDGYAREAVASFAASLERFYEYVICCVLEHFKIILPIIEDIWKPLSKQSERQLGAFIVSYTLGLGESPKLFPQKQTEFRNRVIHQGSFPTQAEAITYGQAVMDYIRDLTGEIQAIVPLQHNAVWFATGSDAEPAYERSAWLSPLDLHNPQGKLGGPPTTLATWLAAIKEASPEVERRRVDS